MEIEKTIGRGDGQTQRAQKPETKNTETEKSKTEEIQKTRKRKHTENGTYA